MQTKTILLFIGVLFLASVKIKAQGLSDANEILTKTDQTVFAVKDKSATIKMVTVNLVSGKEKVRKATSFQKDTDKKLFRFTYPKGDSGISTLSLPGNEVYLYLPIFKKAKRITSLAEKNKFNNSDFSFEDMNTKSYTEKYTPELIATTDTSYVLKLTPKYPETNYMYVIMTVNKKFFYPDKIEYFNQKEEKVKEAVNHFKKLGNYWVNDMTSMTDIKKQHKTEIIMSDIKINTGLKDELFTVMNLESASNQHPQRTK